ncbi:MAG: DUF58 domain-containing protein [Dehalococcoidia bacterium]
MPFRDAWLLVGGALALIGFGAAEPVISAVGFVIILIGGVSRYWSRHLFTRTEFTARLSEHRAFINEPVTLDVELVNRKALPLPWYEWRMALADSIHITSESLAASVAPGLSWLYRKGAMGWYERRAWQFTLTADERGHFQVGPTAIKSADLFGVFPSQKEYAPIEFLTVYPRVFGLEDLGFPADRPFGEVLGGSPVLEDPLRVSGLRDYRPGDPLRRIDWKATARTGDLMSRVYEPSATRQLYLCLNIDTMEHAWEGYLKAELERAVSTTASVAIWAAEQKYAVGLLANGSFPEADRPIRLPPSRSRDQVIRILEALAVIQPLTLGDLAGALMRESGRIPAGSTVVCVASLIPEALAGVLLRLHQEGHRVHVIGTSERVSGAVPVEIPLKLLGRGYERQEAAT